MGAGGRRRALVAASAALVIVVLALAALAVYGAVGGDRIANGVSVAGVDVGGMTGPEARTALALRFGALLARPVTAEHGARRWTLEPRRSRVRVDTDRLVAEALARSRQGDWLTRGIRGLFGGAAPVHLPMQVSWSRRAVVRFARRIRRALSHPPRPADIDFTRHGLRRTRGRPGTTVPEARLTRAVEAALAAPDGERRIAVPVAVTRRPKRTLADLRHRYRWLIGVDRPAKELRLYRRLRLVRTYRIAVGAIGHRTAAGRYEIQTKAVDPPWNVPDEPWAGDLAGLTIPPGDPRNPLKARWMGFHDGEGIHGTADIGSLGDAASHGCIRMSVPDVKDLYRRVPLHTPVFIV